MTERKYKVLHPGDIDILNQNDKETEEDLITAVANTVLGSGIGMPTVRDAQGLMYRVEIDITLVKITKEEADDERAGRGLCKHWNDIGDCPYKGCST